MFYIIKAVRKNVKPSVWVRFGIPVEITFSQMAAVLEHLLAIPKSDRFEFEFYKAQVRVLEWHDDSDYEAGRYSYFNAPDTYLEDWLEEGRSCTFRLFKGAIGVSEYSLKVEKFVEEVIININGQEEEARYPFCCKAIGRSGENDWNDLNQVNVFMRESCRTHEKEPQYDSFENVWNQIESGKGLSVAKERKSRDIHTKKTGIRLLKELVDGVRDAGDRIHERRHGFNRDYDVSGENALDEPKGSDILEALDDTLMAMARNAEFVKEESEDKSAFLEDMSGELLLEKQLGEMTIRQLKEYAEISGLYLSSTRKADIVAEIKEQLLTPSIMKEQLLAFDHEEVVLLKEIIDSDKVRLTDEEADMLDGLYDICLIMLYEDNTIAIDPAVVAVFCLICRHGYLEFHAKARWLITCLRALAVIHSSAPIDILFKMYRKNSDFKQTEREEFERLLWSIPDFLNPCLLVEGMVVYSEMAKGDIWRDIEKNKRDVPYYIPNKTEIETYSRDEYPSCDEPYARLKRFFERKFKWDSEYSKEMCHFVYEKIVMEDGIRSVMEYLDEKGYGLDSKEIGQDFIDILMDVQNKSSRRFILKGHTPDEMIELLPKFKGTPKIVPMSSLAAETLETTRNEWERAGFDVDTLSNATTIKEFPKGFDGGIVKERKVYPNDPCPCGSGKKYKRCCGKR